MKASLGMARDRHVAFDPAARVQHERVGETAHGHRHVVGADALQEGFGIACLRPSACPAWNNRSLPRPRAPHAVRPVHSRNQFWAPEAVMRIIGATPAGANQPGRSQPCTSAKAGAVCLQRMVERCSAQVAGGLALPVGPVHGIGQYQGFGCAFAQVGIAGLELLAAARVHLAQIHGRMARWHDPLRQGAARAGALTGYRWNSPRPVRNSLSDRVPRPGKAPVVGIAFRPVEEGSDACFLQQIGTRFMASSRTSITSSSTKGRLSNSEGCLGMPSLPQGLAWKCAKPNSSLPASSLK